jgi:hypothetical protein
MNARGITELTTTELPDELQFQAVRFVGWMELAVWPTAFLAGEILAWMMPANSERVCMVICAMLLLVPLATMRRILTWRLSVTSQRFEANGCLDQFAILAYIPHRVVVPLSKIKSMGYHGADDHGFYLDCGMWKKENVLPGLTREQSHQVAVTILRRFPQVGSMRPQQSRVSGTRYSLLESEITFVDD